MQILPSLCSCDIVHTIIVSHGKNETYFETPDLPKVKHYKHYKENDEWGMIRRYWLAKFAPTEAYVSVACALAGCIPLQSCTRKAEQELSVFLRASSRDPPPPTPPFRPAAFLRSWSWMTTS